MSTKNEIINDAYTELRISGITVNPTPGQIAGALNRLEGMMSEYFVGSNLGVNYNFEVTPSVNSQTGVQLNHKFMMIYNLAVRLIPSFNKAVPQTLLDLASSAFSSSLGTVAAERLRHVQPSRRMPKGSGNTVRNIYLNRFSNPIPLPPSSSANNRILAGETDQYEESYKAWLGDNTIASFTITSDPRLTIVTSANADPLITYTITAVDAETQGIWQFVKIEVTDSIGRVDIRLVSFEVGDPPEVP